MLTTDTRQPAILPSEHPAAAASPTSPPAPLHAPAPTPQITDPASFLAALIASKFDFSTLAATLTPAALLDLIASPALLASVEAISRFAATCAAMRQAELRQIALAQLATLIQSKTASPIETRRAATTIVRATNPPPQHREPRPPRDQPSASSAPIADLPAQSATPPTPSTIPNTPTHRASAPAAPSLALTARDLLTRSQKSIPPTTNHITDRPTPTNPRSP